ncbi:MAG: acyl-CoA/acyl-ACP dehydrogenase [Nitrospinae bacterium]|nr:acyl-CoA/acyl-ACP dehydrogenase [Nitrospinota bacterium]
MDFAPGEATLALQGLARDFARQEIAPRTDALDQEKDPENRFPREILEKGDALGLRTLPVPESFGGGGADLLSLCFVAEEIGWGDLGVGVIYAQDWSLANAVSRLWDEAGFVAFAENFVQDHALHLAYVKIADAPAPEDKSPYTSDARQSAVIQQDGDGFRLNGGARHVLNGAAAGLLLLESDSANENERRIFLLENRDGSGVEVAQYHDPMGMRSCPDVDLRFEDVKLDHPLDCTDEKWRNAAHALRILPAAAAIGTSRKSHEHALEHARERVQGGKPIIEHQTVGFMLCDNLMELDAARRSLQAAAWAAEHGEDAEPWRSFLAKAFATESCERVARRAMEVWGGAGYMTEAPMERLVRDVVAFAHAFGMGHAARSAAMDLL